MSLGEETLLQAQSIWVEIPVKGAKSKKILLQDVSLQLDRGKVVTIIGPNGAGKSTLLRSLVGLMPLSRGAIEKSRELSIGYMPQKINLDPRLPLTVFQFLRLWCSSNDGLEDHLEQVNALHLKDFSIHSLSGGEMQRVLLARALLKDPSLLVLDEPAQGVDVLGQTELYTLIHQIRKERNCGVLLVSHDLHIVMARSDEVICLNRHVCCAGHPRSVSQNPQYHQLFGMPVTEVLAPYTHNHDHRHDDCDEGNVCSHQHPREVL